MYFAEFGASKLASIDPKTMQVREYPLPNANGRPRRIAITSDDAIWYTDYARGYVGRFDPKTGSPREGSSPGGPNSGPYGITTLGDDIWYSESGPNPNALVRFDPQTEKFATCAIPSGAGVVRNMTTTRDGKLVLACSGVEMTRVGGASRGLLELEPERQLACRNPAGRVRASPRRDKVEG